MNHQPRRADDLAPAASPAEEREAFSWSARGGSFRFAFRGIRALLRWEHNAWLHLAATVAVLAAGGVLGVSRLEWCALIFAIAAVFSAEAFNTAVETLADAVHPERNLLIGRAKDLAAAGVLLTVFGAMAVGLTIFLPRIAALAGYAV